MAPEARLVELLEVTVTEGKGSEPNPFRYVTYYFHRDGTQAARRDKWEEERVRESKPDTAG